MKDKDRIRELISKSYAEVATKQSQGNCCSGGCCGNSSSFDILDTSAKIGYTSEDISNVPIESNMGLGCGNPIAIALLKEGEVVLDLGSGGGFDCFLASRQVGETGFVIGVYNNVEFRLGEIEYLPVADESVDVIISNCVINLSPDKENVFKEAHRVLKAGGRLSISDVVATAELPEEIRKDLTMMTGCIAGAEYVDNIRTMIHQAGFRDIKLVPKDNGKEIVKSWVPDRNIEDYVTSFIIEATK
jgi:SAM-dependent methyltransferase